MSKALQGLLPSAVRSKKKINTEKQQVKPGYFFSKQKQKLQQKTTTHSFGERKGPPSNKSPKNTICSGSKPNTDVRNARRM
jgi:hypothetical protein